MGWYCSSTCLTDRYMSSAMHMAPVPVCQSSRLSPDSRFHRCRVRCGISVGALWKVAELHGAEPSVLSATKVPSWCSCPLGRQDKREYRRLCPQQPVLV